MSSKDRNRKTKFVIYQFFDEEQNVHFTFCEKRPILFTKSLWFDVSVNQFCRSAPVRAIYTSGGTRTVAARCLTYHPGSFRGPRDRRKAAGRHPWIPYGSRYIYWLKSAKEIAWCPAGPRADPLCKPPGFPRVVYGLPVWIKRRENWGQRLWHTGAREIGNRKWPIHPFLLAVRGPGVICESPLTMIFIQ